MSQDKIEWVKNLVTPVLLMFRDGQASLETSLERVYKICQLFESKPDEGRLSFIRTQCCDILIKYENSTDEEYGFDATVQEMVEEIEEHWEIVAEENHLPYFRFDYTRWQAIKARKGVK